MKNIKYYDKRGLPIGMLRHDGTFYFVLPNSIADKGAYEMTVDETKELLDFDWELAVFKVFGHGWRELKQIPGDRKLELFASLPDSLLALIKNYRKP